MQKKLIALAVAGLVSGGAFAQSNVTLSGNAYFGFDQNKTSGGTVAAGAGTVNRVSDHSSSVFIKGTEDLGGGLKFVFQIDSRYTADVAGGTWAGGNTYAGFAGGWGTLVAGKLDLHYSELAGGLGISRVRSLQSLIGHGIMSEVNGTAISPRTRSNNVMRYTSPNMSGFQANVAYSTQAGTNAAGTSGAEGAMAADGSKGGAMNITLKYANGPINAGYSYWKNDEEGGNGAATHSMTDQRSDRLWGRYKMSNGLSLGLGWDSSKYDSTAAAGTNWVKRTAWMLAGSYAFGANMVHLQYAKAGNTSGAGAADTSSGANAWMLGFDHALSKRTTIGATWTQLRNDSTNGTYEFFASPVSGGASTGFKSTQLHIGMAHSF